MGTGTAREPDPTLGEPPEANWCFDIMLETAGVNIGTATDCLQFTAGDPVNGIELIATSLFHFKDGTLVSQGPATAQPVLIGATNITHSTISVPDPGHNSVLFGTGIFEGATGPVRLSGAVDMSKFTGAFGDPVTFDCLFMINVTTP